LFVVLHEIFIGGAKVECCHKFFAIHRRRMTTVFFNNTKYELLKKRTSIKEKNSELQIQNEMTLSINTLSFLLSVLAPTQKHNIIAMTIDVLNDGIRKLFPTLFSFLQSNMRITIDQL
jgi:hypothetical protein